MAKPKKLPKLKGKKLKEQVKIWNDRSLSEKLKRSEFDEMPDLSQCEWDDLGKWGDWK